MVARYITTHNTLVVTMGILGNIFSGMVYLAPLPTFIRIYRKQSTEGFQSLPYVVALFSSMLWLFYAFLKRNDYFLFSINSAGCIIEAIYVSCYYAYASRKARILTAKLVLGLNLGSFSFIVFFTYFAIGSSNRVHILGVVCAVVSATVYMAPLTILAKVMRTRSLEFMPITLSFFLTLSAVIWFFYGLVQKDICISLPNVVGFIFGVLQMLFYGACKYYYLAKDDQNLPDNLRRGGGGDQIDSRQEGGKCGGAAEDAKRRQQAAELDENDPVLSELPSPHGTI